jgi:hypothetical protein
MRTEKTGERHTTARSSLRAAGRARTALGAPGDVAAELARQIETLLRAGYPELAGLSEGAFLDLVAPLEQAVDGLAVGPDAATPFLLVVDAGLAPPGPAMERVELGVRSGFTEMDARELERFVPIDRVEVPRGAVYLITDVDTGAATLGVTPDDALDSIAGAGRSPLTIPEGIALLTHHPDVLRTRNAFSLLGSRCGDRRVTAMWISGGRPRLGWCWAGAPHSWLGCASCSARLGGG